jgi:hypothetical protein
VLYGGTAIALRIGHRFSVDFDFFTEKPLEKERLLEALPFIRHSTVIQDSFDTLTVLVSFEATENEYVKVSFFGRISYGRVGKPERTEDGVLQVASLDDLMATKVKVILQRIQAKDYMDIAAMVRVGVSLEKGLAAAREMFGTNFQPSECLKAMVYFEGGDLHTLSSEVKKTMIEAVKTVRRLPPAVLSSHELALPIDEQINDRRLGQNCHHPKNHPAKP